MQKFFQTKSLVSLFVLFGIIAFFMREDVVQIQSQTNSYDGNSVKFQDAEFTGESHDGKEYMLKAKDAKSYDQDSYVLDVVEMSYDLEDKSDLTLSSKEGEYNKNKQTFIAIGDVKISLQNIYFIFTSKLFVNLYEKIIYTDDPVEVKGSGFFIHSAKGINVDTKKKVVDYYGPIYSKFVDF